MEIAVFLLAFKGIKTSPQYTTSVCPSVWLMPISCPHTHTHTHTHPHPHPHFLSLWQLFGPDEAAGGRNAHDDLAHSQ